MLCGICSESPAVCNDGSVMLPLRVMTYNILADELSSNLVPRTMEEPSSEVLQEILGDGAETKWREVDKALNNEYRKWHPMKTLVTNPQGLKMKSRGLWDQLDLTLLEGKGWQLDGVHVEDPVTLDGGKTFLGVVQQYMTQEQSLQLYKALEKVHLESRAWEARGPRILEKLKVYQPTVVALQEYDVHDLTTGLGTFRQALEGLGYEGLVFLGPGQEKVGVALFWLKSRAKLEMDLPEDRKLRCGASASGSYGNIDLEEPGLERPMDRRPFGYAKLLVDDVQPVLCCVTHLMTSSRDKDGAVRKQELQTIRQILESQAEVNCPVVLCGDFNINLRSGLEEHIFEGTGHCRDETQAARFHWRRGDGAELLLRDAFDDVNTDPASSSTRTGTRLETIDYIFYDEQFLQSLFADRSLLQCPKEAMPNKDEPSDHIPVVATFVQR
ncbi:unnamed protein product [Cladocopium goreaui]|uniref:Endonuclease/exonuclease/phosphatase domain-containing protein n=1 Tax=Cladocopium goreaui TaxID=2562237 RepID=A0A9P1CCM9_9DINO|nr:unnamed protein product [Cladocopium goreaui]